MEGNTASLRSTAPNWSLAGDKQLLDILQNIHQSLVTRCQEVNRKLDEMVTALDGASVDLQNVNNKFMALSNSQFIESRVYDDDADLTTKEQPKEAPKPPESSSDLEKLKASILVLENSHDLIEILHSDSEDSEDDDVTRTVLKPKDRYAHRPLPHIIGSQAWRNKWHAGLHPEDSDSDSSVSKREPSDEQYSDSEQEHEVPHTQHDIEESTGSSESSEQDVSVGVGVGSLPSAGLKPSPSDIAAELARRLGGNPDNIPIFVEKEEYSPPPPTTKNVYRPDQPSVGTVFSDEPPPLDQIYDESPDDDIFAELHKSKPYSYDTKEQIRVAEDLFSGLGQERDIFSDFKENKITSTPVAKKPLFEDEPEPELFASSSAVPSSSVAEAKVTLESTTESVKKPIGGISLFGNNKGAESIGAAILRRKQKSSDEDDEPSSPPKQNITKNKEKDIFDDLFAKSEKEQKKKQTKKEIVEPKKEAKVDLFSDNIFDDIDDIFTSTVPTVSKKTREKQLFDEDDDIFSDIAVSNSKVETKSSKSNNKSIFDSDDDLFTDVKKPDVVSKPKENKVDTKNEINNEIFSDFDVKKPDTVSKSKESVVNTNNEINDDIFSDFVDDEVVDNKTNVVNVVASDITNTSSVFDDVNEQGNNNIFDSQNPLQTENKVPNDNMKTSTKSIFEDDNEDLFSKMSSSNDENSNVVLSQNMKTDNKSSKSNKKSALFDDDSDENDLFGATYKLSKENNTNSNLVRNTTDNKNAIDNKTKETPVNIQKSSIFGDDTDEDDIFATASKKDNEHKSAPRNSANNNKKDMSTVNNVLPKSGSKSLFDDNDSDDSDLFSKHTKLASSVNTVKAQTSVSEESKPTSEEKVENYQKPIIKEKPSVIDQQTVLKQQKSTNDEQSVLQNDDKPVLKQKPIVEPKPKLSENKIAEDQKPIVEKPPIQKKPSEKPIKFPEEEKISITEPSRHISKVNLDKVETDDISDKVDTPKFLGSVIPVDEPKNDEFQDDIFKTSTKEVKTDIEESYTEPEIPDFSSEIKTEKDNKKDALFSEPKVLLFNTPPAVFDDIFSEPPAFQKSSEPKKSKNVNALFDDDSDDEALFFKKNDAILDEKPVLSPDSNSNALFGIFHDEPPAIDVDFTQKTLKSNLNDSFLNSDSDDDFFTNKKTDSSEIKTEIPFEPPEMVQTAKDISSYKIENTDKPKSVSEKSDIFEQAGKIEPKTQKDTTDSGKKVGKLKTMNFNIDVSTLLPGASPKKKSVEQTDGQSISIKSTENIPQESLPKVSDKVLSTKSTEDLHTKEKHEPAIVKSISFDGEPESNILDNKLSKERAKIQVKRRPSTRRARKEAVRKSAIDLADDSTDNSSSIDEPARIPKTRPKVDPELPKPEKSRLDAKSLETEPSKNETPVISDPITDEITTIVKTDTNDDKMSSEPIISEVEPSILKSTSIDTTDSKENTYDSATEIISTNNNATLDTTDSIIETLKSRKNTEDSLKETIETSNKATLDEPDSKLLQKVKENIPQATKSNSRNVTSKIVYILNDEDIFSNPNIEQPPPKPKVLSIVDDNDDDLFKNVGNSSKTVDPVSNISTLGNAYKEISNTEKDVQHNIDITSQKDDSITKSHDDKEKTQTNNKATNLFDEDKPCQSKTDVTYAKSQKAESRTKKSLFDDLSDDEDELFNKSKKVTPKPKGILDSDSEDDLFGGGRKKEKIEPSISVRETKDVKAKVEVKSSLFGDDEDDDDGLFGVKGKSNVAVSPQPTRATKEASKLTEPVFYDPLSLLGGEDD